MNYRVPVSCVPSRLLEHLEALVPPRDKTIARELPRTVRCASPTVTGGNSPILVLLFPRHRAERGEGEGDPIPRNDRARERDSGGNKAKV